MGFGWDFQQRIGFGVVAVGFGRFVFPFYAYRYGGFPVADFGGTPAQGVVAVFGAAVAVFYFNELVVAVPMVVCGFAIAGFADQVAALVVVVVYACILFKQVAPDFV